MPLEEAGRRFSMEQEQQAIARLKQGDLSGLECVVDRYYHKAVRAAYLVVDDPDLAEDIVQTKFVQLPSRIDHFDVSRPFGPWFLRSVINAAINAVEARSRLIFFEDVEGDADALLERAFAEVSPGPEAVMEAEEMRYYLELGESEMTLELSASRSSVKWWLHTARLRLRQLLPALDPAQPSEGGKSSPRQLEDRE